MEDSVGPWNSEDFWTLALETFRKNLLLEGKLKLPRSLDGRCLEGEII